MKISLLYPLWTEEYEKIGHFAKKSNLPPLNLAYLAAIAESHGHEARIIDGEAERLSIEEIVNRTSEFNPEIAGITATTPFYHISSKLARKLKERNPGITIVIGGPHVTVLKEEVFEDCFDFAFIGESDNSWSEFLQTFEEKEDFSGVKGILYRKNSEALFTGKSNSLEDINSIPFPARHLLKNENYTVGTLEGDKRFTSIMTVRGCPYKCIFCSTNIFGKDTRTRDPEIVIKEMQECIDRYGVEHFWFLDDTLTLNKKHISKVCDLMIEKNLKTTFEGSTRANLVDEELIKKMRQAGLIRLSFGLESVDETIRKLMKKQVPLESYVTANKLTDKYGIETLNSCMIGLPGETEESIKATLRFLREHKEIKHANFSIAVPYPGTELYEMAKRGENGLRLETKNYSEYRRYNAAVMSVGNFSPVDLIRIQNEAFASIYCFVPERWPNMLARTGIVGARMTLERLMKC